MTYFRIGKLIDNCIVMRGNIMSGDLHFICNASESDFTEWKHICGLENYTSNNKRQLDTTRVQYDTTRVQHETTRVQYDTSRV